MTRTLKWGVAGLLALHGLVHLMGLASYLRLAEVSGLPYKTAVLGGQLELGAAGTALFGLLWGGAALGFLVAAWAFVRGRTFWRPLLLGVTALSLLLTGLDYGPASAGIVVNLVILAGLLIVSTGHRSPTARA